jgi:hypothetical protein
MFGVFGISSIELQTGSAQDRALQAKELVLRLAGRAKTAA